MLAIEREWRKHPGWFAELAPSQQAVLLAEHRVVLEERKEAALRHKAGGRG